MTAGSRRLFFIGLIIFSLSGLVAFYQARLFFDSRPDVFRSGMRNTEKEVHIVMEKYFTACGHVKPVILPGGVRATWDREGDLNKMFPPDKGWRIQRVGGNLKISQEIDGLCPECLPKRHLGIKDGFISIYEGPAGSLGKLLRVTGIRISSLPPLLQEKIRSGQAEFHTEKELMEALDSLDEFRY